MDTIKELSCSRRTNDLWEEEYYKSHTKQLILTFPESRTHTLRMLGPFVFTRRLYIPTVFKDSWGGFVSKKEIENTVNGDTSCYVEILKKLKNKIENEKVFKDKASILKSIDDSIQSNGETAILLAGKNTNKKNWDWIRNISLVSNPYPAVSNERNSTFPSYSNFVQAETGTPQDVESDVYATCRFLNSIKTKQLWQKNVMVNVMLRSEPITFDRKLKVLCIIPTMLTEFKSALSLMPVSRTASDNCLISGLFAHDIQIRKTGRGKSSSYNIEISQSPVFMEDEELKSIFSSGLIDIPSLIKGFNDDPFINYLYELVPDCKTKSSFMSLLKTEMAGKEENVHIEAVDDSIHKLPPESFEKVDNSSIGSLEL